MIKNERQYRITKAQADRFDSALSRFARDATIDERVHPLLHKAQEEALRSQLADLRAELEEYEALRSGRGPVIELDALEDLPRALIQARIASGWSQKELAHALGLKEQQVQRYEATEYASVSLARVLRVARTLGLEMRGARKKSRPSRTPERPNA
jgi:ribosome-binding protein aMBF1 (putative translation factor)